MVLFGQRTSLIPRLMNRLIYGNYLNNHQDLKTRDERYETLGGEDHHRDPGSNQIVDGPLPLLRFKEGQRIWKAREILILYWSSHIRKIITFFKKYSGTLSELCTSFVIFVTHSTFFLLRQDNTGTRTPRIFCFSSQAALQQYVRNQTNFDTFRFQS